MPRPLVAQPCLIWLVFVLLEPGCSDDPAAGTPLTPNAAPATTVPPPPLCFGRGTEVATPQGSTPIERLSVGDLVQSYDFATSSVVTRPVIAVFAHPPAQVISLGTLGESALLVTPDHPVYSVDAASFVPASGHLVGGRTLTLTTLWSADVALIGGGAGQASIPLQVVDVFDITVADAHNFFANGVLVHNKPRPDPCFDSPCPNVDLMPAQPVSMSPMDAAIPIDSGSLDSSVPSLPDAAPEDVDSAAPAPTDAAPEDADSAATIANPDADTTVDATTDAG